MTIGAKKKCYVGRSWTCHGIHVRLDVWRDIDMKLAAANVGISARIYVWMHVRILLSHTNCQGKCENIYIIWTLPDHLSNNMSDVLCEICQIKCKTIICLSCCQKLCEHICPIKVRISWDTCYMLVCWSCVYFGLDQTKWRFWTNGGIHGPTEFENLAGFSHGVCWAGAGDGWSCFSFFLGGESFIATI